MKKLTILFTSDLHANLENLQILKDSVIDTLRAANNTAVLLFDCGDFVEGSVYAFYKKGTAILDLMRECGYSGMVLGNHEFTCGLEGLISLVDEVQKRDLKIVCTNLSLMKEYKEKEHWKTVWEKLRQRIHPYLLIDAKGVKVGILGLLGEKVFVPEAWPAEFRLDINQLRTLSRYLKNLGAEIIVALFHGSLEEAKRLAEQVKDIDFLLCGHSHSVFLEICGEQVIAEAGAFGEFLGIVEIELDETRGTTKRHTKSRIVKVGEESRLFQETARKKQMYLQLEKDISTIFPELTGRNLEEEISLGSSPRTLIYAIVDAIRRETQTNVAFVSLGENPLLLSRGDKLRVYNLFEVGRGGIPYHGILGGTLCKFYLTLQELKTILEFTVCSYKEKGWDVILIPSGIRVVFDSSKPFFKRVIKLEQLHMNSEVIFDGENWYRDPEGLISIGCSLILLFGMRKLCSEYSKSGLIEKEILPRRHDGGEVSWEKVEDLQPLLHYNERGELGSIWKAVLKLIWDVTSCPGESRIVDVSGEKFFKSFL